MVIGVSRVDVKGPETLVPVGGPGGRRTVRREDPEKRKTPRKTWRGWRGLKKGWGPRPRLIYQYT